MSARGFTSIEHAAPALRARMRTRASGSVGTVLGRIDAAPCAGSRHLLRASGPTVCRNRR